MLVTWVQDNLYLTGLLLPVLGMSPHLEDGKVLSLPQGRISVHDILQLVMIFCCLLGG